MSISSHEAMKDRVQFYAWLGAGAVTLGVGAAMASGCGIAQADSATGSDAAPTATSVDASGRGHGPTRTHAKPLRAQSVAATPGSGSTARAAGSVAADSSRATNALAPLGTSALSGSRSSIGVVRASVAQATVDLGSSKRSLVEQPVSALGASVASAAVVSPRSTAARAAAAVAAPTLLQPTANAEALTPKDKVDISFDGFNNSIGWIPGVGTVINGIKLAIDVISLVGSVITLNTTQIATELGNLVVDVIGLVPVVGGPVASLIYESALGGSDKLGRLVQESLQATLSTDATWSADQLQVEFVDVSPGIFGSYTAIATVSTPTHEGVGVAVDVINNGFETSWSVPIEGRLALVGLTLASL